MTDTPTETPADPTPVVDPSPSPLASPDPHPGSDHDRYTNCRLCDHRISVFDKSGGCQHPEIGKVNGCDRLPEETPTPTPVDETPPVVDTPEPVPSPVEPLIVPSPPEPSPDPTPPA